MTDKMDLEFDVVAAVQELHRVVAPSDPDVVKGARLVFDVCGWAYLYYFARSYGSPKATRRMAENVAVAAAAFHRWTATQAKQGKCGEPWGLKGPESAVFDAVTICRKGEAGKNGAR